MADAAAPAMSLEKDCPSCRESVGRIQYLATNAFQDNEAKKQRIEDAIARCEAAIRADNLLGRLRFWCARLPFSPSSC